MERTYHILVINSGLKEFPIAPGSHTLNAKAAARAAAERLRGKYEDFNLLVCHLGGGSSTSVHRKSRLVDSTSDGYAAERVGGMPFLAITGFVAGCFSGNYTQGEIMRLFKGKGGLMSYLGTSDLREVERRIDAGDRDAAFYFDGMVYQQAKYIGAMATTLDMDVDAIVLTGGMAHFQRLVEAISSRVLRIAPVIVIPGSLEMDALARGALRIIKGEEKYHLFGEKETETLYFGKKLNCIEVMLDNHHVHLRRGTIAALFGESYVLPVKRDLGGGEYVSTDSIDISGPRGGIRGIRVVGPCRPFDQAELLASDAVRLGARPPVAESGQLENACELTLTGPAGSATLLCGIIAARHVHISTKRLGELGLKDKQLVSVTSSGVRSVTFHNVMVRENAVSDVNVIHHTPTVTSALLRSKDGALQIQLLRMPGAAPDHTGYGHLGVRTEDIVKSLAFHEGLDCVSQPLVEQPHQFNYFIADPDGYETEIVQPKLI